MAETSHALNRRIGMLVDRAGRIEAVAVGDARRVEVPRKPSAPSGRDRFCTLRWLATRLGDEPLTSWDLVPLALHRLDALAVVGVGEDGAPGPVRVAHLLPADERDGNPAPAPRQARSLPPGAATPGRSVRGTGRGRREIEDVVADGARYRLFPPRPPSLVDDDFMALIGSLEEEFERRRTRTKISGKGGRAILVHVTRGSRVAAEESMAELDELSTSAGLGVVDQNLSPAQAHAIAESTAIKVIDRSQLILDIFARRARTHEGKIQVELAQLKYLLPRLMSRGDSGLSRLEGGIGGRGPGEQKLEVDRRRVRDRIQSLEKMLAAERTRREQRRSRRRERDVPVVSLVGYTNAGKSTLLNILTKSEVFVEHRMFATLDPSSRRLRLPREREIVINDTVGFIRDLPKDLLAAFRATLEEIEGSDLLVHLVDMSHPRYEAQIAAVEGILKDLGVDEIPRLVVFNKADLLDEDRRTELASARPDALVISAVKREGIRALLNALDASLASSRPFHAAAP